MTQPNSKIVYWVSSFKNVETSYGDYSNSGVIMSDSKGIARLSIIVGNDYIVPYGMIGKVGTVYY